MRPILAVGPCGEGESSGVAVADHRCAAQQWRKSTRSTYGSCVEVRFVADSVQVRNSHNPDGPILVFTTGEWNAFLAGANDREFDCPGR